MTRFFFCLLFTAALLSACQTTPYASPTNQKTISVSTENNMVTSPLLTPEPLHCERFEASMNAAENKIAGQSSFDSALDASQEKIAMTSFDAI